jgi:hypothetical protein
MTKIDLRPTNVRNSLGLLTETVSKPFQYQPARQEHRPVIDTEKMVIQTLYEHQKPMTRLELARALGRSKTPHFVAILERLVDNGLLVRCVENFRGVPMFLYEVAF